MMMAVMWRYFASWTTATSAYHPTDVVNAAKTTMDTRGAKWDRRWHKACTALHFNHCTKWASSKVMANSIETEGMLGRAT